jgi:hypothetical protein
MLKKLKKQVFSLNSKYFNGNIVKIQLFKIYQKLKYTHMIILYINVGLFLKIFLKLFFYSFLDYTTGRLLVFSSSYSMLYSLSLWRAFKYF